jgi:catechol 2,3-dioxygenase-like lactoylglutathione lyase family enzyme
MIQLTEKLEFHHVGCLTENMEESLDTYVHILGLKMATEIIPIVSQQVKVCFIETSPGIFLELVEPQGDNFALRKLLKGKNPFYHMGYMVRGISEAISQLEEVGFYLVNRFQSEAFQMRECAFLYTREMHLVELIER